MTKVINKITRQDVEEFTLNPDLDNYQRFATKSAIYPGQGTMLGLAYVAIKGCGEAGEFAEHVGKAMRDDDCMLGLQVHLDHSVSDSISPLTQDRREKLIKEIGDELWYIAAKCNELGISLGAAARVNLAKLCERGERGTMQGSGDDR